jgi:signal transduction histidine kinase/CheY-like chemotaxis protein
MSQKLISKLPIDELLEIDDLALAISNNDFVIVWYNKGFKDLTSQSRIKGKSILNIFPELKEEQLTNSKNDQFRIPIAENDLTVIFKPLKSDDKKNNFLINLKKNPQPNIIDKDDAEIFQRNLKFQNEFKNILTLLVKENSLDVLSDEILKKCVSITKSDFGFIVFHEEKKKYNYHFYEPKESLKNKDEIKKEIESSFSFVDKWLVVNKRPLVILNTPNNIGYNITQSLQSETAVIAPCFFDSNLLATIVVAKKQKEFSTYEATHMEQFASLLSFAISSIKTRELNTTLENRLQQAQKLETIGKLTSGMAHDFSNLLSSIFGSLNLLKRKVQQNDDIFRLLDNIENCSVRAKDLTQGLLSFGKPTPKRKELIKPNQLLSEISKVVNQTFPRSIIFETEIDNDLHDMLGNGTEVYQVLLNLCVNAKEAITGKGKIKLIAHNISVDEKNRMKYPLLDPGNYAHISVSDSGSGIEEEHLQKIFDPYFSTKDKVTGGGLGLYVTYGIIKAHNGHVEVSSEVGVGTTFDVFFPSFEPTKAVKNKDKEKIILLADDEVMLRDLLAELLESNGYNVVKVSSGDEVLKVLTEEIKADLIIIDYNMPGINGLDCIKQIRDLKFDMPVILSSGSLSFAEDLDYKKIGINSLLAKPYEFDSMLSLIKKLI